MITVKLAKKIFFWLLFPFTLLLFGLLLSVDVISHYLKEFLHKFEAWALDYGDNWEYLGDGIWKAKDD